MSVEVALETPLANALSNVVQTKLSEVGWSTGGLDDSALSEYIILMLVNGKTQEQIATELATDLLNLEPGDSAGVDFAAWLFQQVDSLNRELNGISIQGAANVQDQNSIHFSTNSGQISGGDVHSSRETSSADTEMGDAVETPRDGPMYVVQCFTDYQPVLTLSHRPTGPKSMRTGKSNLSGGRRMMGQISKAMDRSGDSVLHRVRPQQGTERVNTHNRPPPKGPRADLGRPQRPSPNGRIVGGINRNQPNGVKGAGIMPQVTPQQQMAMLQLLEQQAQMMSQIMGPQQQQMLMTGVQPVMNSAFQNGPRMPNQQSGKSLFERIDQKAQRGTGGNFHHQNHAEFQNQGHGNNVSAPSSSAEADISSSMEVESSQPQPKESIADTVCKFNLTCTKKDCQFAHQSPAAPPGRTIDVHDICPFGAACKNHKCVARHPSPAQKTSYQHTQECKYFPNCTNPSCPFQHPTMPICRNGADCNREGCKFTHVKANCKFNPCLNRSCPYKHIEGQQRGTYGDKVWTAEDKEHVSERKFVPDGVGEEELIVPEGQQAVSQAPSLPAEVVT